MNVGKTSETIPSHHHFYLCYGNTIPSHGWFIALVLPTYNVFSGPKDLKVSLTSDSSWKVAIPLVMTVAAPKMVPNSRKSDRYGENIIHTILETQKFCTFFWWVPWDSQKNDGHGEVVAQLRRFRSVWRRVETTSGHDHQNIHIPTISWCSSHLAISFGGTFVINDT